MALVKLEYIYKLMEEKELPFFKVSDGKTLIAKNNDESEPIKARELLEETLEMIEDTIVTISLGEKSDKAKAGGGSNWGNYTFKVRLKPQEAINGAGGINGTILSMMRENAELLRKLELQGKEHEMAQLKKEIAEIKTAKDKPNAWEQYIPMLMNHFTAKTPIAVAGANDGEVDEQKHTKAEIVRAALVRLQKVDKNLPETLTILADFAEQHPEKYNSFIPIVKSQI